MYERHHENVQPSFGQDTLQIHYIDTDRFGFRRDTKDVFED